MEDAEKSNEYTRALFQGVAPERSLEIEQIFNTVQYDLLHDRPLLHFEAAAFLGKGVVRYTNRSMHQIWLIAYLSWKTLHEQSVSVLVALGGRLPYEPNLLGEDLEFTSYVDRLTRALSDLRTAEVGSATWPIDVPKLDPALSELNGIEDRATYDLACFAGAFVLLHETCHALKRVEGEEYGEEIEELECDRYAFEFLLTGSEIYAGDNPDLIVLVQRKRAIGIILGLAVTFESTELGVSLPSVSHPSAHQRITQFFQYVTSYFDNPNDQFWLFACCLLLSKVRRGGRLPPFILFNNVRELTLNVLDLLKINTD